AHDVLPPIVPLTHSSSSIPGPFSAPQPTPIREPTPVREPLPYPRSEKVGTTTSIRPPSLTRQTSFQADVSEGGGDFVSSPQSNEAPPTPAATAAGGAKDSAALTALFLKLDRCLYRITSLENELRITKKVLGGVVLKKPFTSSAFAHEPKNILAGAGLPAAAITIPAGSSMDVVVHAVAAPLSSIPSIDKGKAPMVDDSLPALLGDDVVEDNMNEQL
nr:hypothetical protein [Tanacetum cinerariifolium]GFC13684.1 hypothetical protein [Tanacetum cinerariifolium]